MQTPKEWEKEFDETFPQFYKTARGLLYPYKNPQRLDVKKVKKFISTLLEEREREAYKNGQDEIFAIMRGEDLERYKGLAAQNAVDKMTEEQQVQTLKNFLTQDK